MDIIVNHLGLYADGLLVTIKICVYGLIGSLILGTLVAIARVSPVPALRVAGTIWVQTLRNCPVTVVLFFFAFGLPEIGINVPYFWFGVSGLIVYTSSFVCEAVRSGIGAVQPGQSEAARAIGLPFAPMLRYIVIPQAFRYCIPPLANALLAMIKDSAIVGAFGVGGDLFSVSDNLTSAQGFPALPVLIGVVLGYLILIVPSGLLFGVLERRTAMAS